MAKLEENMHAVVYTCFQTVEKANKTTKGKWLLYISLRSIRSEDVCLRWSGG